ncbi:hypothetical protein Hanom_Chr01g00039241 [Helianthus anomalus]
MRVFFFFFFASSPPKNRLYQNRSNPHIKKFQSSSKQNQTINSSLLEKAKSPEVHQNPHIKNQKFIKKAPYSRTQINPSKKHQIQEHKSSHIKHNQQIKSFKSTSKTEKSRIISKTFQKSRTYTKNTIEPRIIKKIN